MSPEVPKAKLTKRRRPSAVWLAPVVAGAVAGYLVHQKLAAEGPRIEVTFQDASGLKKGSDVRYRGVAIGAVESLALSDDRSRIDVSIKLDRSAESLARKGSMFWIVRPEVGPRGVTGLGAIVSGSYVEVKPGRSEESEDRFKGRETPPVEKGNARDLEIVLTEERLGNAGEGTEIFYRGVKVGVVRSVKLASDGRGVRIDALIEHPYVSLVRANTRFWDAGELKFHFGLLSGVNVGAKSLGALVSGGLAFATPDQPGAEVKDGHVFALEDKMGKGWDKWKPSIKIEAQVPEPED